jgi:putative transposase
MMEIIGVDNSNPSHLQEKTHNSIEGNPSSITKNTDHRSAGVSPACTLNNSTRSAGVPPAKNNTAHKGWYSRGYLPHFDSPNSLQLIAFRLNNSLPDEIMFRLKHDLQFQTEDFKRKFIDKELDKSQGSCYLANPEIASVIENSFKFFDGFRYRLISWVVMPNHVHVLIRLDHNYGLSKIVYSWKSFTAHKANQILKRSGRFWQREYWDRLIRDEEHFNRVVNYIHMNPVKAGLVEKVEEWRFSSVGLFEYEKIEESIPAGLQCSDKADLHKPAGLQRSDDRLLL